LKIICSGHLVRYPLGGHSWHHLQYLIGLRDLGHEVIFFEDHGWSYSCYDPTTSSWTSNPEYGLAYTRNLFETYGLDDRWCYLAENGAAYGMSRDDLAQACRESDLYINLSNINWITEVEECRRRILVDTDPVFTQISGYGMGGPFERYDVLFTYGENVSRENCSMPTAGRQWNRTRQPVVLKLWPVIDGPASAPLTTVINWSNFGERQYEGRVYGQKDREFEPFISLPHDIGERMQAAVGAPDEIKGRLRKGGWDVIDPWSVTKDPWVYQQYLSGSRAEFCVAKHAYVSTRCGWFSDRSSAYLASGRPVVIQDTGFSDFLPCGEGLFAYEKRDQAVSAITELNHNYEHHCRAARAVAEEYFNADRVLNDLLERSL
jgi:hypothetical protein